MGFLLKYIRKYRFLFATAVACVGCEAVCDLLQPTIMAAIIDGGIKDGSIDAVLRYGLLMLLITAFGAGFATTRNVLAGKVSQSIGADIRYDVFSKIMHFSEVAVDRIESGSLITRMTNDTSQVTQFINGMMRIFFKAPVICLGGIILAMTLSPKLGIILFSAVAAVSVLISVSMKLSYSRFAKVQAAIDRVNTTVQEYLMGVRLVKAFGRFRDEEQKFNGVNTDLSQKSASSQRVVAYFSPLISLSINLGVVLIIYIGSLMFGRGDIEVGKISAFTTYMTQILMSLMMITNIFNSFVRTRASSERIREVLDGEEDFAGTDRTVDTAGSITFENVTFAYPHGSGIPALKNLSFHIGRGETLAIIGPTGSGKSTVAWLCLRFYDADSGTVRYNGEDIRKLDVNRLRENVALAPQKSMLFTGTVYDNIAWGRADAGMEEVGEAAAAAYADEFIGRMPEGYQSMLGQGGVNLSGGQKQRISIARALLKQSPVLILDDCTSALDSVTEAKVRRGLGELRVRRTVLIITQRIGTAMTADKILVLDNSESVGLGTHSELLASCRTYREIYDSQIGGDLPGDADA